jgi:cell division protein FtsQ
MRLLPRRRPRPAVGSETSQDATEVEAGHSADTEETVELHLMTVGGPAPDVGSAEPGADPSAGTGGSSRVGAGGSSTAPADSVAGSDSSGGAADTGTSDPASNDDSVRAARRRFVRRRWGRRWLAWRRVVAAVLLVALVAGSVWLVFFSSVLAVNGVRVDGTSVLAADAVRGAAEVPTGTPLATADLDSVAARVERLPAVRSVDVSRAWPDQVRIDVTERQVVAVVAPSEPGGRFRGTDAEGVFFRSYARRPPGLPLIRMQEQTGAAALAEAATVSGSLPAAIARRVAEVRLRTVDTISLSLRDGRTVRWGSVEGSGDKARVLAVLLGQKASFIDVSVPGRPVIRR